METVCTGWIPLPVLLGAVIDSTCRLWQTDSPRCSGSDSHGSCLLFDTDQLRWRMYGGILAVQSVQLMFVILIYCTIKRRRFNRDDVMPELNVVEITENQSMPPQVQTQ